MSRRTIAACVLLLAGKSVSVAHAQSVHGAGAHAHVARDSAASPARTDTVADAAAAGSAAADAADFVTATRAGIARFHDRNAAIAAGYRRLGPAFPGMGEHWINPGLIVRPDVAPGAPSVLCYADVNGRPHLIGAAYAFSLPAATPLPPLPGGSAAWHIHDGAVDEETLLLVHPAADAHSGMRLVMAHVWSELENADGVFAQNNWALPFLQAGLSLDVPPDMHAAQALSLLTAGPGYYLELFVALAAPDARDRAVIAELLGQAGARVASWRAGRTEGAVDAPAMAELAAVWSELWVQLDASIAPATATRLHAYRERTASHH